MSREHFEATADGYKLIKPMTLGEIERQSEYRAIACDRLERDRDQFREAAKLLVRAINAYQRNDGTRGRYCALGLHDAHEKIVAAKRHLNQLLRNPSP